MNDQSEMPLTNLRRRLRRAKLRRSIADARDLRERVLKTLIVLGQHERELAHELHDLGARRKTGEGDELQALRVASQGKGSNGEN
jgi:hypothetical protein